MSGHWGIDGSARPKMRRALRERRERERRLVLRHRWYAGGIATLLTGALLFTGVTPAVADVVPPPPTEATTEATEATAEATAPEEPTSPADETAAAPEAPAPEASAPDAPAPEAPAPEAPAPEASEPEPGPTEPAPAPTEVTEPKAEDPVVEEPQSRLAPQGDATTFALLAECTGDCLTITRNVIISGGGPASASDWDYRAASGADWHVIPVGSGGVDVGNGSWVISASSVNANTANYVTTISCTDQGRGLDWDGDSDTLEYTSGDDRSSTCTFRHTYQQPGTITIQKGGIRTGAQTIAGLPGATFEVYRGGNDSAPDTAPGNLVGDCVTAANGQCSVTVPSGQQYWIVEKTAPAGWNIVDELYAGSSSGSQTDIPYRFRTNSIDAGSNTTYPLVGTGQSNAKASSGYWADVLNNPTALQSCGIRVGLLIDLSNSIDGTELTQLKNAATGFVDALQGTPSSLALWTFATSAPADGGSNSKLNLTSVSTPAGATTVKNKVNGLTQPGGDDGATNWDQGLWQVANDAANEVDVLLMLTDGTPTVYGPSADGPGSWSRFREVESAVFSSNAVKNLGTRVVPVGIGVGDAEANIQAISGPTINSDYFLVSNYAALAAFLQNLAKGQCESTVNVTKMVIPTGGTIAEATPMPGWGFSATSASTVTPSNGTTNASGAISFKVAGLTAGQSAAVSITEEDRAGYTPVPQGGKNAVCKNDLGQSVPVTNIGALGFTANATGGRIVTCTVYNEAPNPQVKLQVVKKWVINGTAYDNGAQPFGSALLKLDGQNAVFGSEYTYNVDEEVAITETVSGLPPFCTNSSTGTGTHTMTADPDPNVVTITNTVTCTTKLTLSKKVEGGEAVPSEWTLTATAPGDALPGPDGSAPTALTDVTPGARYVLAESGGDPRYAQEVDPNADPVPGATGSWHCYVLNADGTRGSEGAGGLNGWVEVQLGQHVDCEAINRTSTLVLLKHVVNDDGGDEDASAWDLTATPAALAGLTPTTVEGSETAGASNTIQVRPDHTYTISETGPGGYSQVKLQQFANGGWIDVAGWDVSVPPLGTATYRVVNDDIAPTLTLEKKVVNNGGGSATADQWTLTAENDGATPIDGTGTPVGGDPSLAAITGEVVANLPYTLSENGPSGYAQSGPWSCVLTGTQTVVALDGGAITVPLGEDVTCRVVNDDEDASGSIAKSASPPVQQPDGTWTIDYTVTVTNNSATASYAYVVDDTFHFGSGITGGTAAVIGSPASGSTLTPGWDGDMQPELATGTVPAGAGSTHVYAIRVTGIEIADAVADGTAWQCDIPKAGGFLNRAELFRPGGTAPVGTAHACEEPAFPDITKVGTNPAAQNADASWNVEYTVTVSNSSDATAVQATLTDVFPIAPAGWTLGAGSWTVTPVGGAPAPSAPSYTPGAGVIWQGALPADTAYSYAVTGTLVPSTTAVPIGDCATQGGLMNRAAVTSGEVVKDAEACVSIVTPPVSVTKTDGTVTQLDGGDWQIDYTVTVTNSSNNATVFALEDVPELGAGFSLVSGGWHGPAPVANTPIAANSSLQYVYRVVATFDPEVEDPELECAPGQGGAFYNVASIAFPGGTDSDDGCANPAKPVLTKVALPSTQDPATGAWTLRYRVSVTNPTGIELWYSVTDEPEMLPAGAAGGAWQVLTPTVTGGGAATVNPLWNGSSVFALATGQIPNGATHSFTLTRTVTIPASVGDDVLDCQAEGGGLWNGSTVTNGVGGNSAGACAEIERPGVGVVKTVTGTSQRADGTWDITYSVVVTNESTTEAAVYDLDDTLAFGGDIEILDAAWSGPAGGAALSGPAWTAELATARVLAPHVGDAGVDTYTVTAHADVDAAAWEGDTLACQDGEQPDAGGFLNTAVVTVSGEPVYADDCVSPELPTFQKLGVSATQDPDDASRWLVSYELRVTTGGYDSFYSLSDTPAFAPGITVLSGTAQRTDADPDGPVLPVTSGVDFVTDVPIGAADAPHVYTVSWLVDLTGAFEPDTATCDGTGTGFFNTALLSVGEVGIPDDDCIPVEDAVYPVPVKTVTSTTQDPETGDWRIVYDIDVALAAEGPENPKGLSAEYDLTDTLEFGGGIDIGSASWTGESSGDFPGPDETAELATDKTIDAGETHTYTVTVVAAVTGEAIDGGTTACLGGEVPEAGGFLNTALLTSGAQETPVDACSEPLFPAIDKSAGTVTDNGDGTWELEYFIDVTYPASDVEPLPESLGYVLTDAPELPVGVELDGDWTAEALTGTPAPTTPTWNGDGTWTVVADGELTPEDVQHSYRISATVTVLAPPSGEAPPSCGEGDDPGHHVWNQATVTSGEYTDSDEACETVHYDDVSIVKSATGLPEGGEVEPGDTFSYELTVANNGTRPATDVAVTDVDLNERLEIQGLSVAPAEVSWGPAPGWTPKSDTQPNDRVDLTIDSLAVGASATIVIDVLFPEPEAGGVPPLLEGDEVIEPPTPVDVLENTACVAMAGDRNDENDCDSAEVPARDIVAAVYTRCVNDAPLLGWTIVKSASLAGEPIEFLWTPDAGTPTTEPQEVALTQPAGTTTWSDEIAWPGTAFTPSGISIDYPGWRAIEASDIVPDSIPTQYYLPGTDSVMTPEQQAEYIFNGLILDPSELDFAWRNGTTITFTVNPTLEFSASYPAATPACFVARHTEVQIEKTASVERTEPGDSFAYTLGVANVSDDAAAEGVVVTDPIPADIRITDVTWPGKDDADAFPNWQSCAVTGQNGAGYGGTLECVLYGPLQPIDSDNGGASAAPTITLHATVNPASTANVVTNTAVVDYHTFGDPDDPGRDTDDATVLLSALPITGGSPLLPLVMLGFLALLAGATAVVITRRRRGERLPVR